jgi:hypothetical protein
VLLTDDTDEAFVLPEEVGWPTIESPATTAIIRPKKIGQYNKGTYAGNSRFIPAGTPVIIRTLNDKGYVTMALPNATPDPSASLASGSCIFSGKYLEQMLSHNDYYIYVFGRSLGKVEKAADFATTGHLKTEAKVSTDIGFYVNANPNKESSDSKAAWIRNNKYVLSNKIYYHATETPGASSRELTRSPEFIPVVFDDEEGEEDEPIEESLRQQVFNGCVYDLQGRCVATEEMVKDGTWRRNLKHGIYILNGKKVYVK